MKAGVISDIHGNLPALEEVLEDMPAVDHLWCLGDIIGYNPWPRECLEQVRDEATALIQDNHDRRASQDRTAYKLDEETRTVLEWTRSQLSDYERKFLKNLPTEKQVYNDRVLLSHSDPRRVDGYVYPNEFQELKSNLDATGLIEVMAMGHSHVPHADYVGDVLVLNPGSVGQHSQGPEIAVAMMETALFAKGDWRYTPRFETKAYNDILQRFPDDLLDESGKQAVMYSTENVFRERDRGVVYIDDIPFDIEYVIEKTVGEEFVFERADYFDAASGDDRRELDLTELADLFEDSATRYWADQDKKLN